MGKKRYADGALMGGGPKVIIVVGATLVLLALVIFAINMKATRVKKQDHAFAERQQYLSDAMLGLLPPNISRVTRVFVIPGGGPGREDDEGYPQWTRSRTLAAFGEYQRLQSNAGEGEGVIFYALSAGSLNGPNRAGNEDGKIVFECQHVLNHLIALGVPRERLFGDFISWDTTANALSLRLLIEGLISTYSHDPEQLRKQNFQKKSDRKGVVIDVFSSDFHTERIKLIFSWVLSLSPSLDNRVQLNMFNIPSMGVGWTADKDEWNSRMAHERNSIAENKRLHEAIKTFSEFQAFLLLGGHKGYRNYMFSTYQRSAGAGW